MSNKFAWNPPSGERHPNSKVSDADAELLRWRHESNGETARELGPEFGVSKSTADRIIRGERSRKGY